MQDCSAKKDLFDDKFFKSLLALTRDHQQAMSDGFLVLHTKLNDFLLDVAREYSKHLKGNEPLQADFFALCMLNALFGNPARQLNRLHWTQQGPTAEFSCDNDFQYSEDSLNMKKRRRNAVTEVLRLICQVKYQSQDPPLDVNAPAS